MSTMDAEVFEAFRSIGIAYDKAILAAQALSRRGPDIDDLKSDVSALKHDMASVKPDVAGLKQDVASLKTDMVLLKWMVGFSLAMSLTILFKVFHV